MASRAQSKARPLDRLLGAAALEYASRGWSVFPLEVQGKAPLGALVRHGLQDATCEPEVIKRWWECAPNANIGLRTGIEFDVLDLDSDDALQVWLDLCKEHGFDPHAPPRVSTGGGGRHLLFAPTGAGNRTAIIDKADWRGVGGYIVAPPSVHAGGAAYAWKREPNGMFPEVPKFLLELVRARRRVRSTASGTAYGSKALEQELSGLLGAREGERNDALNRAGFAVYQLVAGGELRDGEVTERLRSAARGVGLGDDEIEGTLRSARDAGFAEPRTSSAVAPPVRIIQPEQPWPTLDPVAMCGLAGEVVHAIEPYTEADPVGLLALLLTNFGNLVGGSPHRLVGETRHPARLFPILVGRTARGRKGETQAQVDAMLRVVDEPWTYERHASGLVSAEGLITEVRDPVERLVRGKIEVEPGVEDKRLYVVEPEFARVLRAMRGEGSRLSHVIRDAWDDRQLRSMAKNSPLKATGAHISIVGHITADELRSEVTSIDMSNGFMNRFLLVCVERSKELPEPRQMSPSVRTSLVATLQDAAEAARKRGGVPFSPAAAALWQSMYHELTKDRPGMFGALTARSEPYVLRLALTFALMASEAQIFPDHLQAAAALWRYVEASTLYVFGDATGNPTADDIVRALRGGDLSQSAIYDALGRNVNHERIAAALSLLTRIGRIRSQMDKSGKGRPATMWALVK